MGCFSIFYSLVLAPALVSGWWLATPTTIYEGRASTRSISSTVILQESLNSGTPPPPSSLPTPRPLLRKKSKIILDVDGSEAALVSRTVEIFPDLVVTIWEMEKMAAEVEEFWANEEHSQGLDPFGKILWPGSIVAAQELSTSVVKGTRVLILGAGCGIEAQVAARLGAASVLATDIHPTTLQLLEYGAEQAGGDISKVISTALFDIASSETLPDCDLMVVADVLYNDHLAAQVVRRCVEARSRPTPPMILITDSQGFVRRSFDRNLNSKLKTIGMPGAEITSRTLHGFTGSGVAIDDDQTYDAVTRIIWIGR